MTFRRSFRVRLIGVLALAILFAQVAIAAYACPAIEARGPTQAPDRAGVPCAEMTAAGIAIDPELPTLCMQHCQFGSTAPAIDQVALGVALPGLPLPTLAPAVDPGRDSALSSCAERERLRDRPPPLSHSVAHCCYRI